MLIIEGVDRTGKTTVARALSILMPGAVVSHFNVPEESVFDYHAKGAIEAGPRGIVDRLHWSEYAYGKTYRGGCGYQHHEWVALEAMLLGMRAKVILMTDTVEAIAGRWEGEEFNKNDLPVLCARFDALAIGAADWPSVLPRRVYRLRDLVWPNNVPTDELKAIAWRENSW